MTFTEDGWFFLSMLLFHAAEIISYRGKIKMSIWMIPVCPSLVIHSVIHHVNQHVLHDTPVTVAEWLQWLPCPLPTGRRWLGLVSNPGGSVGGVPDHA